MHEDNPENATSAVDLKIDLTAVALGLDRPVSGDCFQYFKLKYRTRCGSNKRNKERRSKIGQQKNSKKELVCEGTH